MGGKRDIEPSRFKNSALAGSLRLGGAVVVFAGVALTLPTPGMLASFRGQPGDSTQQGPEPDIFVARFPMELGVPSRPAQREDDFRRGVA